MTDELKPCLAYPCDGYMKENNYDASLECTSCQFIVADELEYSALVAGRQAAINAELESVAQALENGSFLHEHSPPAMLAREAAKVIRAKFGTNPLAEAQARIAELERDSYDMACRQCVIQDGLLGDERGNAYCRLERELAEAKKDAERYRWIQRNAEGFSFETPQWDWTGGVLDQLNEAIDTAMQQEASDAD